MSISLNWSDMALYAHYIRTLSVQAVPPCYPSNYGGDIIDKHFAAE